jgi:hypothetical protein
MSYRLSWDLGPGKHTAKLGFWFGEIERKLAKLSLLLTVLPLNYFMVKALCRRGLWSKALWRKVLLV